MNRIVTAACIAVASLAFAQSGMDPAPQPSAQQPPKPAQKSQMGEQTGKMPRETVGAVTTDITKAGPATRKVTDERKLKKEIEAFLKAGDEIVAKNDFNAKLERLDFPLFLATDDQKGMITAKTYTKEEYSSMMKSHFDAMKESKKTHKETITVLSDNLATVVDDYTLTLGKQKVNGKSTTLLVKVDGQWKVKSMIEAGWGEMHEQKPGA